MRGLSGQGLSQFLQHEVTGNISTPPWMGYQLIAGFPMTFNLLVPIYTPWWSEGLYEKSVLPKNNTISPTS